MKPFYPMVADVLWEYEDSRNAIKKAMSIILGREVSFEWEEGLPDDALYVKAGEATIEIIGGDVCEIDLTPEEMEISELLTQLDLHELYEKAGM